MWWKEETGLIPKGIYNVTLSDCKLDTTKEPKRMTIEWELANKRKCWQNFTFGEKQVQYLQWQLGILGVWQLGRECETEDEMISKVFDGVRKLIDKTAASIEVKHNDYDGKTYLNVIIKHVVLPVEKTGSGFDNDEVLPF